MKFMKAKICLIIFSILLVKATDAQAKEFCFNQSAEAAFDIILKELTQNPPINVLIKVTAVYGSGDYIASGTVDPSIKVVTNAYEVGGVAYVGGNRKGAIMKPFKVTMWFENQTCALPLKTKIEYGKDGVLR